MRRRNAVILTAVGLFCVCVLLLPLLLRGFALIWMAASGSPREAQCQAEDLGASLRQFLLEQREPLEELRAAAKAGQELPGKTVQEILDCTVEQVNISDVYAENGEIRVWLDNSMYTGKLYTHVTFGSGEPPLPDGTTAEEDQTFWTLNDYMRMEILEDGWYAEYEAVTRG